MVKGQRLFGNYLGADNTLGALIAKNVLRLHDRFPHDSLIGFLDQSQRNAKGPDAEKNKMKQKKEASEVCCCV